jgi:hypothetical protein
LGYGFLCVQFFAGGFLAAQNVFGVESFG